MSGLRLYRSLPSRLVLTLFLIVCLVGCGVGSAIVLADVDTAGSITEDTAAIDIDERLDDAFEEAGSAGETIEVVVQLEDTSVTTVPEDDVEVALEEHATDTQQPLLEFVERTDGVTLHSQFWLTNAVLLEFDAEVTDLDALGTVDDVEAVHGNIEIPIPEPPSPPDTAAPNENETVSGYETTYGLAQIGAPVVWDEYEATGAGVTVAVLDTGLDADHPDVFLYTEDSTDPSYPGGWAEFDERGEQKVGSSPHDSGFHGTHVSGTIVGGDASGVHVGVAPDATLIHGKVLGEENGTYAQILAGMEWAVEADADVVSMSFGASGTFDRFIPAIRAIEASGAVPVAAIGNNGHGTSASPGNVYESIAIGATDADEAVASFSSGETLTSEDWSDPPTDWPDEYVVPDLVAPGVAVYSTVPGGGHDYTSGTSMATPHVAGTVALMLSVDGDLRPSDVESALSETARKPTGAPGEKDERYGVGIVDVQAAITGAESTAIEENDVEADTVPPEAENGVEDDTVPPEEANVTESDSPTDDPEPAGEDGLSGFGIGIALGTLAVVLCCRQW